MNVVELKPSTIAKLELGQDDVVVIRSSSNLDAFQAQQIGETARDAIPDHKILVLAPNMSIEVIARKP